ncbi:hypothetical protein BGZ95_000800 [Linnemannia exigua]|uniref:Arm-like repeat domain-containing protein n=1 Tax=Linnemannia exigua TaxID=604196 RepID=A0AAD4H5D9_9FUNG|nr:hypothetical protein BGZ95_000800 [Linnemannia exigua]
MQGWADAGFAFAVAAALALFLKSGGLVQLLQDASPGYLIDDDLTKILRVLREQLETTFQTQGDAQQSAFEHFYRLARATSRVLDAMVEGNVEGLERVEEHEPILATLADLRKSSDPYLKFQAVYAIQVLQYVGDDGSPLQTALRIGGAAVMGVLSVASIFRFDPEDLFNGLRELGLAAGQAYDVAKAGIEGNKAARVTGSRVCIRAVQLAKFKYIVYNAPCRHESEFLWSICQLLGEMGLDQTWEKEIRQQAVMFLLRLYMIDKQWTPDAGVRQTIVQIAWHILEVLVFTFAIYGPITVNILQDAASLSLDLRPCPLLKRLSLPKTSSLLLMVQEKLPLNYSLHLFKNSRLQDHQQVVYIRPHAGAGRDSADEVALLLMAKVKEFLEANQQLFLIIGDSRSGKSTFNKHLEYILLKGFKVGDPIPLYVHLLDLEYPRKDLIPEQLKPYGFSNEEIQEIKRARQLINICDGYDEVRLRDNLHKYNCFNHPNQWDTKMISSCRSTHIRSDYRE